MAAVGVRSSTTGRPGDLLEEQEVADCQGQRLLNRERRARGAAREAALVLAPGVELDLVVGLRDGNVVQGLEDQGLGIVSLTGEELAAPLDQPVLGHPQVHEGAGRAALVHPVAEQPRMTSY